MQIRLLLLPPPLLGLHVAPPLPPLPTRIQTAITTVVLVGLPAELLRLVVVVLVVVRTVAVNRNVHQHQLHQHQILVHLTASGATPFTTRTINGIKILIKYDKVEYAISTSFAPSTPVERRWREEKRSCVYGEYVFYSISFFLHNSYRVVHFKTFSVFL